MFQGGDIKVSVSCVAPFEESGFSEFQHTVYVSFSSPPRSLFFHWRRRGADGLQTVTRGDGEWVQIPRCRLREPPSDSRRRGISFGSRGWRTGNTRRRDAVDKYIAAISEEDERDDVSTIVWWNIWLGSSHLSDINLNHHVHLISVPQFTSVHSSIHLCTAYVLIW